MVVPDGIFPCKLHDMLEYAARYNMEHASVAWTLNGTAFIVNDPDGLMEILPLFFGQTKYRSFRRQLNIWSFERIDNGPKNKGAVFQHPYFIRGQKHICENMTRDSFKRSNSSSSSLNSLQAQQARRSQQQQQVPRQGLTSLSRATSIVASDIIIPSRSRSNHQVYQTNIPAPQLPFSGVVSDGCLEKLVQPNSINLVSNSFNNMMMTKCSTTNGSTNTTANESFMSSPNSAFGPRKVSACNSTASFTSSYNNHHHNEVFGCEGQSSSYQQHPPPAPSSPMSSSMGSCGTNTCENGAPNEEWDLKFLNANTNNNTGNSISLNLLLQQPQFQPVPLHPKRSLLQPQDVDDDDDDSLLEFAGKHFYFLDSDDDESEQQQHQQQQRRLQQQQFEPKQGLLGMGAISMSGPSIPSVSLVNDIVELFRGDRDCL